MIEEITKKIKEIDFNSPYLKKKTPNIFSTPVIN